MKFTRTHEWISFENIVGITQFAQKELGDVVYVELPEEGAQVEAGVAVAVLESTKAASDIYSPVSGKITAVNQLLKERPELINQSPEDKGWIFKIEPSKPKEMEKLLSADTYHEMFE